MDQLLALIRPDLQRRAGSYAAPDQPEASASDLVQNVCLRAWQNLHQFGCGADDDQACAQFRAWVIQILHRLGLNTIRFRTAQRRRPGQQLIRLGGCGQGDSSPAGTGPEPAANVSTPSSRACAGEQASRVQQALAKVPEPTDRAIVRLRFFEGLSLRQIAERLHLSEDKVRERYRVTLRRLQRELGGLT